MKVEDIAAAGSVTIAPHETIIQPNQAWLRVDWALLWEYRDLLALLIHREFASKYKQTILGPAWFILQPLMTSIVFTIFFGRVAKVPTDGIRRYSFTSAISLGGIISSRTSRPAARSSPAMRISSARFFFPRLVVPISVVLSNLFACVLQLGSFLVIYLGFMLLVPGTKGLHLTPAALLLPLLFFHTGALSLGVCLWMSSLTAKYRDLNQVMQLLVQLWMFASPVIYSALDFPVKWRWVAELNPMTAILEAFRLCLLGIGHPHPGIAHHVHRRHGRHPPHRHADFSAYGTDLH